MATDKVTGKRNVTLWILITIGGVIFASILAFFVMVMPSTPDPRTRQPKQTRDAGGSARPTLDELRTGESPEKVAEERAYRQFEQSLGLSDKETARREQARAMAKKPAGAQKDRVAQPVDLGGEAILADVDKANMAPVVGTSAVDRDAKTGQVVVSAETARQIPYMPFRFRKALASEKAEGDKGNPDTGIKGGDNHPVQGNDVPMKMYEDPKFDEEPKVAGQSADPASPSSPEAKAAASRIPVNILPPMTVPIPARFQQNFIVVGAGADTSQRVVVKVQQDVVHRHRVQLPKECVFIGNTGGTRDLDLVDIEFDTVQFPDGTQVPCKARAYQPYDPSAPDSWGMRGVIGEYEEPPLWSKFGPILLEGLRGYSTSNLDRLSKTGLRVEGDTNLNVQTSSRDRLYGALSSSSSKAIDLIMQNLNRYRPRVRIRAGQPLVILLDDYLDVSKRSLMGHSDPLKDPVKKDSSLTASTPMAESSVDQEALRRILSQADPKALQKAAEYVNGAQGGSASGSGKQAN